MELTADVRPSGSLGLKVIRNPDRSVWPQHELTIDEIVKYAWPQRGADDEVNAWRRANKHNLARGLRKVLAARALKIPHIYGALFLTKLTPDGPVDLGLASMRLVTANGVKAVTDALNNVTTPLSTMNFHGFGTGVVGEAATDTALGTEETTQYATDNTRPTGTGRASAVSGNNATYTTVGTYSPDSGTSPRPITEHGVFSQAATGRGTLLDRSVFSVVNLVTLADSLQATYVLTVNSGG